MNFGNLFAELKRRNVIRMAGLLDHVDGDDAPSGALDYSHAVEKDREILGLLTFYRSGQIPIRELLRRVVQRGA